MNRIVLAAAVLILSSACAETFRAVSNDPVRVELIEDGRRRDDAEPMAAMVSLTAERRAVVVKTRGDDVGRFCAEPPPDVATDLLSRLGARAAYKGTEAELQNLYAESAVSLADRTTVLDVYRTGTYVLCQYHLNNAMTPGELAANFKLLTEKVTEALIASYAQPRQVVVTSDRLFSVIGSHEALTRPSGPAIGSPTQITPTQTNQATSAPPSSPSTTSQQRPPGN